MIEDSAHRDIVPNAARIGVIDSLRGFALLGILVINLGSFSNAPGAPPDFFSDVPVLDRTLQSGILLLVESKFFSLFSLLFGLSFAIQIHSAERQGAAFLPRISRRLLALLGFGLLHVALVWDGDILIIYALAGALLVLFRRASDRVLRRWIVGLLALPLAVYVVAFLALVVAGYLPATRDALATASTDFVSTFDTAISDRSGLLATGSYGEIAVARWSDYLGTLGLLLSRVPTILAMFLAGMWVGRRGILLDPAAHLPLIRRACRCAWLLGAPIQVLIVVASLTLLPLPALAALFFDQALTGPLLAVAYATSLVLWSRTTAGARVLSVFTAPGRMALTTYLSQSVIMSFLFWSWGLALVGRVSTAGGLGIAVLIFIGQALAARLWLGAFRYGPLEWVWRCVTYWARQPIRRPVAGSSAGHPHGTVLR